MANPPTKIHCLTEWKKLIKNCDYTEEEATESVIEDLLYTVRVLNDAYKRLQSRHKRILKAAGVQTVSDEIQNTKS